MDNLLMDNKENTTIDSDEVLEREAKKLEDKLTIRRLNSDNALFKKTEGGFISLEFGKEKYNRVNLYSAFPLTDPENYISVRKNNEEAEEIGIIISMSDFSDDVIDMLKEQLNMRYFMPEIYAISSIKQEYGFSYWQVKTDKGDCCFTLSMHGGAIAHLSDTRLILTDIDGNRFEIADTDKLSISDLKKLDLFL